MTHPDTDLPPHNGWHLPHVVRALRESREVTHRVRHQGRLRELPSREVLTHIMQGLSAALFPTHYGRPDLNDESIDFFVGHTLHDTLGMLNDQVRRALMFNATADASEDADLAPRAAATVRALAEQLPDIRGALFSDLQAAWQGDPAATGMSEILLCYPGITAIVHHRIAHALLRLGTPLLARLIADIAHARTGIDIHPGAQIGRGFFIDHGTGVVIGETCVIGENVRLYQAVTLGAKRFPADENGHLLKGQPRHPIVEDDVVIYAGATVLGRITIGRGSTIGGNVWLTQSVPQHSNVSQALSRQS
ncbi:serine O-acetyltransferase [Aquabacterium commune]|uniref:serine O-acetyltransferase n=1 Tax=Aquabacterium commune TaxID=70586 RepID=A0A4V3CWW7_9BURK|nr:serine O-acetyltransferase EpsC [Aquabacterium commune]TDP88008.1 serine O-acetyltransferase [Aquabacterium commune]